MFSLSRSGNATKRDVGTKYGYFCTLINLKLEYKVRSSYKVEIRKCMKNILVMTLVHMYKFETLRIEPRNSTPRCVYNNYNSRLKKYRLVRKKHPNLQIELYCPRPLLVMIAFYIDFDRFFCSCTNMTWMPFK